VDGAGEALFRLGDPETVTFWRSSAKSFQAIPFLRNGVAEHFGFTEKEIALAVDRTQASRFTLKLPRECLIKSD
jgi:L-asparaginase II